jgi:hypothetical protein
MFRLPRLVLAAILALRIMVVAVIAVAEPLGAWLPWSPTHEGQSNRHQDHGDTDEKWSTIRRVTHWRRDMSLM